MSFLTNLFEQRAAIRPQKIGLKAAAAKRPRFAHGWFRATFVVLLHWEIIIIAILSQPQPSSSQLVQ